MSLVEGTIIHFADGSSGTVGKQIGEGGQGEVYHFTYKGNKTALKWYKSRPAQAFIDNLGKNVKRPSPSTVFLWPKAYADSRLGCGYVMDLKKPEMMGFDRFLCLQCYFKNWNTVINAAMNLCVAFQKLHSKGLAYFDLNDGNFFFNPETGDLQIGDNDNVSSANYNVSRIIGKQSYVAPEVELGGSPDRYSDFFSLAIIMFRVMFVDHPFHGRKLMEYPFIDDKAIRELYGTHPTFIFDRNNKENAADEDFAPNAMVRWDIVPEFIQQAFEKVFSRDRVYEKPTDVDSKSRLMESEWLRLLTRWRSELNVCPVCGKQTLISPSRVYRCRECGNSYPIFWMKLGKDDYIPLVPGQQIFESQIGLSGHFTPVAEVVTSKKDKSILGMRNLSRYGWDVSIDHHHKLIKTGETFPLYDNTKIRVSNIKDLSIRLVKPTR